MNIKTVQITLVEMSQPCNACLITGNLIKEMLDRISLELDYVVIQNIKLDNLKNVHQIGGLEVESFPAIIIDNEQVTAGSIPQKEQLISIIKRKAEENEED